MLWCYLLSVSYKIFMNSINYLFTGPRKRLGMRRSHGKSCRFHIPNSDFQSNFHKCILHNSP